MDTTIARSGKPILVKKTAGGISHFHMPGESEYESIVRSIRERADELKLSFEETAKHLGYELGYAVESFSV